MRVVLLSTSDSQGGAARAAMRLHRALLASGVDSHVVVQHKGTEDDRVHSPSGLRYLCLSMIALVIERLLIGVYFRRTATFFSPSLLANSFALRKIRELDPDLVHLHWINQGLLGISHLKKIKKPIVWSFHDMWPFTGGCHYTEGCERFVKTCCECPVLQSKSKSDLSSIVFSQKKQEYAEVRPLVGVGLSRWIALEASRSELFGKQDVVHIPNPIDVDRFVPVDKGAARASLGIETEKKVLLFGAMEFGVDVRKGFSYLVEALKRLEGHEYELLVFGPSSTKIEEHFSQSVIRVGRVDRVEELVKLYSAADVTLVPSIQENLSNTIMESLACATPVVAFRVGGNEDMIHHQVNGYLAKALDIGDFAQGIEWVLGNSSPEHLAKESRRVVMELFHPQVVARQMKDLYASVVAK